jgi:hypothetical protein
VVRITSENATFCSFTKLQEDFYTVLLHFPYQKLAKCNFSWNWALISADYWKKSGRVVLLLHVVGLHQLMERIQIRRLVMRKKMSTWLMRALIAASAGCAAVMPAVSPAAEGTRYAACPTCAAKDMVWYEGEFDQVHLVGSTGGARAHPRNIATETLVRSLATIRLGNQRLLDEEAAALLSQGLSKAFAVAGPQQEAIFLITAKSGGLLSAKTASSGRAFIDANGVNVIFGEAAAEFLARYRATRMTKAFDFGSVGKPSPVSLTSDSLTMRRPDWVVIPLSGALPAASPATAAPVPAASVQAEPARALPAIRDEHYYAAQEQRLRALKRLREQELISEQEYQAKRSDILNNW